MNNKQRDEFNLQIRKKKKQFLKNKNCNIWSK